MRTLNEELFAKYERAIKSCEEAKTRLLNVRDILRELKHEESTGYVTAIIRLVDEAVKDLQAWIDLIPEDAP